VIHTGCAQPASTSTLLSGSSGSGHQQGDVVEPRGALRLPEKNESLDARHRLGGREMALGIGPVVCAALEDRLSPPQMRAVGVMHIQIDAVFAALDTRGFAPAGDQDRMLHRWIENNLLRRAHRLPAGIGAAPDAPTAVAALAH
jgi:hypothetical protein